MPLKWLIFHSCKPRLPTDETHVDDGVPGLRRPEVHPAPVGALLRRRHALDDQSGHRTRATSGPGDVTSGVEDEHRPGSESARGQLAPGGGGVGTGVIPIGRGISDFGYRIYKAKYYGYYLSFL